MGGEAEDTGLLEVLLLMLLLVARDFSTFPPAPAAAVENDVFEGGKWEGESKPERGRESPPHSPLPPPSPSSSSTRGAAAALEPPLFPALPLELNADFGAFAPLPAPPSIWS